MIQLLRSCAPALLLGLFSGTSAATEYRPDGDPLPHPLLTPEGQAVVQALRVEYPLASDIEILKRINIVESTRQSSEEAEAAVFVGATVPEVEVILGHPDAVEIARSSPHLAADLLALVGPPTDLSSSTITLELLLAPVDYVESVPFPRAVSLAIVREELTTWGDYRAFEQTWRDEKEANGLIALETPLRELEALGAEILAYDPTF